MILLEYDGSSVYKIFHKKTPQKMLFDAKILKSDIKSE